MCVVSICASTIVGAATERPPLSGSGSGFFITPDGFFLTSYHVVKGADVVRIRTGESVRDVEIVKADPTNDIVVLKAEGQFSCIPIGLPADLALGDDVFTIGFPAPQLQGVAPKLTKGNISAASGLEDDPRYFQISIPIQPGNSGGPLVDERGNVVGIVSSTLAPDVALSEGFIPQVVNYAVKTTYASSLLDSIPEVADKLPPPVTDSRKTPSQIRDQTAKSVGLVLVYASEKSKGTPKPQPQPKKSVPKAPNPRSGADTVRYAGLTKYTNTQYRFSALVPTDVFVRNEISQANDRAAFYSADGRSKLELVVRPLGTRTFSQIFQDYTAEHTKKYPNKVVDYKVEKDGWFVVWGRNGPRKFYVKSVLRPDTTLYMYLEYDEKKPPVNSDTLSTMAGEFDGG
jgi:S1-C subfamily serine protease